MFFSSFVPGGDARQIPPGFLSVLLVAVLVVGALAPNPAAAQDSTVVSIQSQEAASGAAVDVPVDVTGFTEVGSVSLIITYDSSVLSFPDDPETSDLISNAVRDGFSASVPESGELRISWFDVTGSDPIDLGEGTLFEITFSEFAGDTTEVAFGPNSEISDADANPIGATFEDGTVALNPNQAPGVGVNDGLTLDEGATAAITTDVLSASDPDDEASDLTFDVTAGPDHGTLSVGGDTTASSFTQADLEAGDVAYSHDDSETTADSFTFDLTDPDGAGPTGQTFDITVEPVDDAPTISGLADADTTIEEDTSTGPIGFTIGDDETAPSDLSVTASTSNPDLVPSDSIEIGGTGADRTVTVTPAADSNGTADITVTVENGGQKTASQTFAVTVEPVNDAPVARVTIPDDTLKTPGPPLQLIDVVQTAFRDPEGDELTVSATSGDPSVVTAEVNGQNAILRPEATGTAEVTLTASDGEKEGSLSFLATVEERAAGAPEPSARAVAVLDSAANGQVLDFGDTGLKVVPAAVEGTGGVGVALFDSGPDGTDGISEENVSQYRAVVTAGTELSFGTDTEVRFPVAAFGGISDPTQVTIYSRPSPGSGSFSALPTSVDDGGTSGDTSDDEIVGTTGSFSEFVLASNTEPLPVELVRFAARLDGAGATLQWETASEKSNAGFTVRHQGPNQQGFSELGFVESKAASGTTERPQTYRFRAEELAPGTHQFRLRQVDLDGSGMLLDTTSVEVEASRELALEGVGSNPVRQSTRFTFSVRQDGQASVVLYNVLGQQIKTLRTEAARVGERYTVDVPVAGLASGVYFVRLEAPSGKRAKRIEVVH